MSKPIPIPPRKKPPQALLDSPEWHPRKDGKRWSEIEDNLLKTAVERHGVDAWGKVAQMVWFRNPAQCRARWAELVPLLHDEVARRAAASPGSPASPASTTSSDDGTIRERSRAASPTSTSSSTPTLTNPQPAGLMCIEGSSPPPPEDAADTAEDIAEALQRFVEMKLQTQTQTPAPAPASAPASGPSRAAKGKGKATAATAATTTTTTTSSSSRSISSSSSSIVKRPRPRRSAPPDASPPLLNPELSPPPPPFEMSPPSPPPGPMAPLRPSHRSRTTPAPTPGSKLSSLSILGSLVAPLRRDRSKTLTALAETTSASSPTLRGKEPAKEPAKKKKSKADGGKEEAAGSDEDQQWLSPHPMMPGLYRKPSKSFSSGGLRK
ncbi:component of the polarisome [Hypoxylon texense]